MVTRWSVKLHSVWNVLKDWKLIEDQLDEAIDEVEDELNIDIEDDVIANFAGHFSMVVLDSQRGKAAIPVDLVLYAPIEDQDLTIETFETLLKVAKKIRADDEIDEVQRDEGVIYKVRESAPDMSICFGMVMEHILVVASSEDCEDIIEDIEDGDEELSGRTSEIRI